MIIELDRDNPMPLYYQLAKAIESQILSAQIRPGDQLPAEEVLASDERVTRTTVRRAYETLKDKGLVFRVHGKGTFVANPRISKDLARLTSFYEDMAYRDLVPSSRLLFFREVAASPELQKQLQLKADATVFEIVRLRLGNGEPIAYQVTNISKCFCPGLTAEHVKEGSLYDVLEKRFHVRIIRGHQKLLARRARLQEARLLEIPRGACVLTSIRTAYSELDTPFEYTETTYRADRFQYEITLYRSEPREFGVPEKGDC